MLSEEFSIKFEPVLRVTIDSTRELNATARACTHRRPARAGAGAFNSGGPLRVRVQVDIGIGRSILVAKSLTPSLGLLLQHAQRR